MPTYAYRCKSCAFEFEEWQKISDSPLVTCPSCKKETLRRVIDGGTGLIFKGSGFYLTDYKKETPKSKEKVEPKSEKPAETPPTKPKTKAQ